MKVLAELRDKKGMVVEIISYHPSLKSQVMELYREGYPDSFDETDLEVAEDALNAIGAGDPNQGCFLMMRRGRLIGAAQLYRWPEGQDLYQLSYTYVKESMRNRGIGRLLSGVIEEKLKEKARIVFTSNAGLLPDHDLSHQFYIAIGYVEWGELSGYWRDDLSAIFLVKRNPYYPVGKGILRNSRWSPELAHSRTGERISHREYQKILHNSLQQVPREKWGIDLIGRENVLSFNID